MRKRQLICTITAVCVLAMLSSCSEKGSTYTTNNTDKTSVSDTAGESDTTESSAAENTGEPSKSDSGIITSIDFSEYIDESMYNNSFNIFKPVMIDDDTICMAYSFSDNAPGEEYDYNQMHTELCMADVHTGQLKQHIVLPSAYYDRISTVLPEGEEGVCCLFGVVYDYANNTTLEQNYITIASDYSFKANESISSDKMRILSGKHYINQTVKGDITDSQSGEILVQGTYSGPNEMSNLYKMFDYAIDDDRFVYTTSAWESVPGIGIYDYVQKKFMDVPDSENMNPIGVYNKKIYSRKSCMSPPEPEFYVTDPDTLETTVLFESSKYDQKYAGSNGFMVAQGKYIVLKSNSDDNLLVIKSDNGEVVSEVSFDLSQSGDAFLLGDSLIGMYEANNNRKMYVCDVNDIVK